tara:strand:+ start:894 stop:1109 length:216 start_codon:yes stop_codon:yes gene_type:complete
MVICFKCGQPITGGSRRGLDEQGREYHYGIDKTYCGSIGCPLEESILDNLRIAIDEGFNPSYKIKASLQEI